MRSAFLSLAAFGLLSLVGCKDGTGGSGGVGGDGGAGGGDGGAGGDGGSGAGGPTKVCDLIDDIGNNTTQGSTLRFLEDRTLESGCVYEFSNGFYVEGGTLTVPANVTLRSDHHFAVEGGTLRIEGTAEQPVRIEVGERYTNSPNPNSRVHTGLLLNTGAAYLSHVEINGQDEGPAVCMRITGDEDPDFRALTVELSDVRLERCLIAGLAFDDFELNLHGPYDAVPMPIKTFDNVSIADAPYGLSVYSTYLTPLPGQATFENVESNYVSMISGFGIDQGRRLQATNLPWETDGFYNDDTVVIEAGVELQIGQDCPFGGCGDGSSTAQGELLLEGTEAAPITIHPKAGAEIGAWYVNRVTGTHVNIAGPFAGDDEDCAMFFNELTLTDSSISGAPGLTALCVDYDVSVDRLAIEDASYGLRVGSMQVKNVGSNNTYTNVGANYVSAKDGNFELTGSNTWLAQGIPWFVDDDLQVDGGTWTLEAGVELELAGESMFLIGQFVANGTAAAPVVISGPSYQFAGNAGSMTLTNAAFHGPSTTPIDARNLDFLSLTNVTFDPGMSITGACNATTLVNTTVTLDDGC